MLQQTNNHHILYCRKNWSCGHAKKLRNHPFMQVELPAEGLHSKIHANLDAVPVPDLRQCKEAIQILHILEKKNALNRHADIFTKINLLLNIWNNTANMKPTCDALKVQLKIAEDYYNVNPR